MDIMKAILDIESKAQGIMNTLGDIEKNSADELSEKLRLAKEQMEAQNEKKLSEHKANVDKASKREISELDADMEKMRQNLENTFSQNRSRWISSITDEITKETN